MIARIKEDVALIRWVGTKLLTGVGGVIDITKFGGGSSLEAVWRNDGYVSGGVVVIGEVGNIGGRHFHWICLISGQGVDVVVRKLMPTRVEGGAYSGRGRGEKGICLKL